MEGGQKHEVARVQEAQCVVEACRGDTYGEKSDRCEMQEHCTYTTQDEVKGGGLVRITTTFDTHIVYGEC